jgi:hypothetical protein
VRYRLAAAEVATLVRLWSTFEPGSRWCRWCPMVKSGCGRRLTYWPAPLQWPFLSTVGILRMPRLDCSASSRPSCVTPEIDRLAAALLLQAGGEPAAAERHLRTALAIARDRNALALELRTAADLRRLELANGRTGDAARVLRSVVEKFTEGHRLADLRDAIELLRCAAVGRRLGQSPKVPSRCSRLAKRDTGIRCSDVHGNAVIHPREQRALVLNCCRAAPQGQGKPICRW